MDAQAKADMIEALGLFNKKAEKLARSEFIKTMFNTDTGLTLSHTVGEPTQVTLSGPDETATDAFALTFRFFYQPGERSSFGKMADAYHASDLEDSLKNKFVDAVDELTEFLDNQPNFKIVYNGELLTRRKILEIFLYGDLAHANKADKVKIFNEWSSIQIHFSIVQNEFNYTLAKTFQVVEYLKSVNELALEQLRK